MLSKTDNPTCEDWNLTIGEVVSPFGRVGEVKVRLETDFPERFARLKSVCLRSAGGASNLYTVEASRYHKNQILLKLKDVETIDDAEKLRNTFVQIHPQDAIALPENEYYIHDLIHCEVVTEEGRLLGKISDVLRGSANDVYVVGKGKEEILLPAVRDVVKKVDLSLKRVVVFLTPGLVPDETILIEIINE